MKTLTLILYAIIGSAIAYVVYRVFKFGDNAVDAVVVAGQKIKSIAGAAIDDVVAGHAAVVNSVSTSFRSGAEKSVDDLYGPSQGWRTVRKPTPEYLTPKGFNNADVYAAGVPSSITRNPMPPYDFGVPAASHCDTYGKCGDYPRSAAPLGGTLDISNNPPPQNNDTIFESLKWVY